MQKAFFIILVITTSNIFAADSVDKPMELVNSTVEWANDEKPIADKPMVLLNSTVEWAKDEKPKAKPNIKCEKTCEEITESYVICNGDKYVLDLKNSAGLKRDMKQIEKHVPGSASSTNSATVPK